MSSLSSNPAVVPARTSSPPPIRADSPVLGFDGVPSDDPLRYPSPNYPRDLSLGSLMSLHPRNAVYLDDDARSVASNAAFDHVRALYQPLPEPTASRWSTASSLLPPSPPPSPARPSRRKRLTSLFSRLVAIASSTPPPAEPREMQKAYLERDDPPIALDLRKRAHAHASHLSSSSTYTFYTCYSRTQTPPPPVPPKSQSHTPTPDPAPHIDYPDTPLDPDLGDLTCHTPPASPTPSFEPEPRRARIKRRLRQQQSMATLNSASTSSYDTDPGSPYWSYSHSSFSLSPPLSPSAFPTSLSPPLSPAAFPTSPSSFSSLPDNNTPPPKQKRATALKALSFPFRSRSRATSLLPSPIIVPSPTPVPTPTPTPTPMPTRNSKRLTIRLSGSTRPVDVILPPSPRGPPPVPPKDPVAWPRCYPSPSPADPDEYIRDAGSPLDYRGRVVHVEGWAL